MIEISRNYWFDPELYSLVDNQNLFWVFIFFKFDTPIIGGKIYPNPFTYPLKYGSNPPNY